MALSQSSRRAHHLGLYIALVSYKDREEAGRSRDTCLSGQKNMPIIRRLKRQLVTKRVAKFVSSDSIHCRERLESQGHDVDASARNAAQAGIVDPCLHVSLSSSRWTWGYIIPERYHDTGHNEELVEG